MDIENQYYNSKGAPTRGSALCLQAGSLWCVCIERWKMFSPPCSLALASQTSARASTKYEAYGMQGMLEGSDPKEALRGFLEVVRMEPEKGEWCAVRGFHTPRAWCHQSVVACVSLCMVKPCLPFARHTPLA